MRPAAEPTVSSALDRVVDAAQGVVSSQVDLARLELSALAEDALRSGVVAALGVFFVLTAWIAIQVAAYGALEGVLAPAGRLGLIAVVNLAVGTGLIASVVYRGDDGRG